MLYLTSPGTWVFGKQRKAKKRLPIILKRMRYHRFVYFFFAIYFLYFLIGDPLLVAESLSILLNFDLLQKGFFFQTDNTSSCLIINLTSSGLDDISPSSLE